MKISLVSMILGVIIVILLLINGIKLMYGGECILNSDKFICGIPRIPILFIWVLIAFLIVYMLYDNHELPATLFGQHIYPEDDHQYTNANDATIAPQMFGK